ncbi:MAG: TolB family protein [Aquaticitalea sp.]
MKNLLIIALTVLTTISYAQQPTYTIKNLEMNDELSQYGAVYQKENKVFYSRYKLNEFGSVEKNRAEQTVFTLYEGEITEEGEIINSKEFKSADEFGFNSSTAAFSLDGKYMYVTTNEEKRGDVYKHGTKTRNLRIERGEYEEGKGYKNFKPLSFCDENYSYAHPAVSPNGDYLYFTSNIPSAKGPTDIFRIKIEGGDKFGDPENLGDLINSPRKEMFPTITHDNVLYFSSDRAKGIGGLDIYKCIIDEDGTIGMPELMPQPINSRGDDICFVLNKNGEEGYFTSNRAKGKGEDDIYHFEIED